MGIPTLRKTEQAWNGLYFVAAAAANDNVVNDDDKNSWNLKSQTNDYCYLCQSKIFKLTGEEGFEGLRSSISC
jgi:hypothetical protein